MGRETQRGPADGDLVNGRGVRCRYVCVCTSPTFHHLHQPTKIVCVVSFRCVYFLRGNLRHTNKVSPHTDGRSVVGGSESVTHRLPLDFPLDAYRPITRFCSEGWDYVWCIYLFSLSS